MIGTQRDPGRPREITDEDILAEIQRLADGDEPPTNRAFAANASMSPKTAEYHFGSWNAAVRAAGFEPRSPGGQRQFSDAEICDWIRRLADGDRPPSSAEFDAHAPMTRQAVTKRFGSWLKAVDAAGLDHHRAGGDA